MQAKIEAFRQHVSELAGKPTFVHHRWFVRWHLEIVERMVLELAALHPEADRDLVQVMAWLHDYGKILDFDHEYARSSLDAGRDKLVALGFDANFASKAADYIEWLDKKETVDLRKAPIEIQIVSTADGCSHLVGPFMFTIWHEATDASYPGRTMDQLREMINKKATKDWERKIVLSEAREHFMARHQHLMEIAGQLPDRFFK